MSKAFEMSGRNNSLKSKVSFVSTNYTFTSMLAYPFPSA